ncbi:MAG: crossover junction endodeoxyribonuclease RuvC [Deltaproteobacteria bacterium]|nr:crossover junction endodeoxyribonuclease RuvC [Deltaproteobacteria bacterium]
MRALGIDPGSRVTGFGVVEQRGYDLVYIGSGRLAPGDALPFPARLNVIYQGLMEAMNQYRPTEAAVEDLFFAKNAKSALILGHARGVCLLAAENSGLPIFEYSPRQIKQSVVGYGAAAKEQVQEMVRLLLGLPERLPKDTSDALATAICHLHSRSSAASLNGRVMDRASPNKDLEL